MLVAIGTLDFEGMIAGKALYAGAFTIDQALGGLGAGLRPLLPGFVVTDPAPSSGDRQGVASDARPVARRPSS